MADFPATQAVNGVMSGADKAKLDGFFNQPAVVQNMVWFHLLPQPASSGTPANATESGASFAAKARFLFNFGRLNIPNTVLSGKLYARGLVSATNGDIRIYNVTDAVEMGLINFTELVMTTKEVALTPIPTSGTKVIEFQMRKSGAGSITIESGSCDFVLASP
jgi:hypothetical protein